MKIIKSIKKNAIKTVEDIRGFVYTRLYQWSTGQVVTSESMNGFTRDLYEKLALLTLNNNNMNAVIWVNGGIQAFTFDGSNLFIPDIAVCINGQDITVLTDYSPYQIIYQPSTTLQIENLNQPKYIYAVSSGFYQNPNTYISKITYVILDHTIDAPNMCLICVLKPTSTLDFTQTTFLVNSEVPIDNMANITNPNNNFNVITPRALNIFKNKGAFAQYDPTITYKINDTACIPYAINSLSCFRALIDNPQTPSIANHDGWCYYGLHTLNKTYYHDMGLLLDNTNIQNSFKGSLFETYSGQTLTGTTSTGSDGIGTWTAQYEIMALTSQKLQMMGQISCANTYTDGQNRQYMMTVIINLSPDFNLSTKYVYITPVISGYTYSWSINNNQLHINFQASLPNNFNSLVGDFMVFGHE